MILTRNNWLFRHRYPTAPRLLFTGFRFPGRQPPSRSWPGEATPFARPR